MKKFLLVIVLLLLLSVGAGALNVNLKVEPNEVEVQSEAELLIPPLEFKEVSEPPKTEWAPTIRTIEKNVHVTQCSEKWESADYIKSVLDEICPTEAIVYGLMGMAYRESQFQSNATGGWSYRPENVKYIELEQWTAEIDAGLKDDSTRDRFITEVHSKNGGYGLFQLWSMHYLETFYDYMKVNADSIGDARKQLEYTVYYIQTYMPRLWERLLEAENGYEAGKLIGFYYDGSPAYESIGEFARSFQKHYEEQN